MEFEEALGLFNSIWLKRAGEIQGILNTTVNNAKNVSAFVDTDVGERYILNDVIINDAGIMRLKVTYT